MGMGMGGMPMGFGMGGMPMGMGMGGMPMGMGMSGMYNPYMTGMGGMFSNPMVTAAMFSK